MTAWEEGVIRWPLGSPVLIGAGRCLMGKGRRVRRQRQQVSANDYLSGVVREALLRSANFNPASVREALTAEGIAQVPHEAIDRAQQFGAVLDQRGWQFDGRGCAIGGQLSWNYPPSRTPAGDCQVWEVSTITVDVVSEPQSDGSYIDCGAAYVALVGADPDADEAWIVPVAHLDEHLAVIEKYRPGAVDPFPQYRVPEDDRR